MVQVVLVYSHRSKKERSFFTKLGFQEQSYLSLHRTTSNKGSSKLDITTIIFEQLLLFEVTTVVAKLSGKGLEEARRVYGK